MNMRATILFSAWVFLAPVSSQSATWLVEKDGSGDFFEIQPAVDAAAAGDTILIGPGRFESFHPFSAPGWTEEVIVGVIKDDLAFIGSGKDVTIVGTPEPYGDPGEDPKCFCSIGSLDGKILNLTIENVEQGIYWSGGSLTVINCTIRGSHNLFRGIGAWFDGLEIIECDFELNNGSRGITTHPPSAQIIIRDSSFSGFGTGFIGNETNGLNLDNCVFEGVGIGGQFDFGTTGSLSNCYFNNSSIIGIQLSYNSVVEIHDTTFSGSKEGMRIGAGSILTGSSVVLENSIDTSILLSSQAYVSLTESHIFPSGSGRAIWSPGFPYEHINQDMQGNYWGTSDPDSIDAMIWDSNDDPSLHFTVLYEPFAGGPVPTEEKSFGSIKAMFR